MPIFDYKCKQCKAHYEYFHSSSSDKKPVCPKCGSNDGMKQVSKNTSGVVNGANAKNRYGLR